VGAFPNNKNMYIFEIMIKEAALEMDGGYRHHHKAYVVTKEKNFAEVEKIAKLNLIKEGEDLERIDIMPESVAIQTT
jgi:hypothetical protein